MPQTQRGKTEAYAAPIVRNRRKRRLTAGQTVFTPPSVSPGVKHVVEGTQTTVPRQVASASGGFLGGLLTKIWPEKLRQDFERKQKARESIVSLPDPDDLRTAVRRRREAARRRRRGRLGTILSRGGNERQDTLG